MEESKIFRIINRINSVFLFLLMLGAVALMIGIVFHESTWQNRRAVEVAEKEGDGDAKRVELILGNIQDIYGHDAHYVELTSRRKGGFSSGYSGGQIRNVLFFVGPDLRSHWLFDRHANVILVISRVNRIVKRDENEFTEALFFEIVKEDSNGDGELSGDDVSVIALSKPDGSAYQEIEHNVQTVIDKKVVDNGKYILLLLQSEDNVVLKKYSLADFHLVSEKILTEISKK